MARFDIEQTIAVVSVQQLINDWAYDLDIHNGAHIGDLVSEDCVYNVGGSPKEGRVAVQAFYAARLARLTATPEGPPTQRHNLSNLRVSFTNGDEVAITFSLVFWTTMGMASGLDHADPAAFAEVFMDCRRDADGDWKIARFDSKQTFRRIIG